MKIRKFNAIIAFISASLALSSCSFFEKGETPKTPTESTLLAVDDRANSYVVGEIFDNYVTNGGLTPKVRMSDNTEKVLTKTDFTYEIKTAADSIVTGTKPFTTSGNYTVTVSKLKLKPVSYTIRVNPKEEPKVEVKEIKPEILNEIQKQNKEIILITLANITLWITEYSICFC